MRLLRLALLALTALLAGCGPKEPRRSKPPKAPTLGPRQIRALIVDDDIVDPDGWATDVAQALRVARRPATKDHVCQVLAIIEQESGYQADPVVPGLGRVVAGELDRMFASLGPAARPVRSALLDQVGPGGSQTFEARLTRVQTEADADRLYREIVAHHQQAHPGVARLIDLVAPNLVERHNPITTAGSMQVSVGWEIERAARQGLGPEAARERLYTRAGGVEAGTVRLFATDDYTDPSHRFADFNAGPYASRNAAFQARLYTLTGIELVYDGDILLYNDKGRPRAQDSNTLAAMLAFAAQRAPELTEKQVRADARTEKTAAFAQTDTYRAVSRAFREQVGREPAHAIIPRVTLSSPKFSRELTTRWFADNARRRYDACMAR